MSATEKRAYHLDRMREPPVRCPVCDMAVQPDDLLVHQRERCQGQPGAHPRARWVTRADAIEMGVCDSLLHYWTKRGLVRFEGEPGARRYLLRDLAQQIAARDIKKLKRGRKCLQLRRQNHHRGEMQNQQITDDVRSRLREMAAALGGVEALSRRLDINLRTLKAAMAGKNVRRGTRVLIEQQIAEVKS